MENKLIIEAWKDNKKKWDFIHSHLGFECDKCGFIPETIYVCWFKDFKRNRNYLRYHCFNCLETLKNTQGYLSSYFDLLAVEFKASFINIDFRNKKILFIAKHFLMSEGYEYIKKP